MCKHPVSHVLVLCPSEKVHNRGIKYILNPDPNTAAWSVLVMNLHVKFAIILMQHPVTLSK